MKSMKLALLAAAVFASASSFAAQYAYQDQQITIAFSGKEISVDNCVLKDGKPVKDGCKKTVANVAELTEKLSKRLKEAEDLLKEEGALLANAKKMATAKDAQKIKDDASGDSYVMLSLGEGFKLPLNTKLIEAGDFSLVVEALKANKARFERSIAYLKSGKLPEGQTAKQYSDISDMLELGNVIEFSKAL